MAGQPPVVLDSMVFINLAVGRLLDAVAALPEEFVVPREVVRETVEAGERFAHPEAFLLRRALEAGHVTVSKAANPGLVRKVMRGGRLRRADASVLATAIERRGVVASDDAKVRHAAEREGLIYGGTGYILARLVKAGNLSRADAKRRLDAMIESGWYCDIETYSKILRQLEL